LAVIVSWEGERGLGWPAGGVGGHCDGGNGDGNGDGDGDGMAMGMGMGWRWGWDSDGDGDVDGDGDGDGEWERGQEREGDENTLLPFFVLLLPVLLTKVLYVSCKRHGEVYVAIEKSS
jgi:hypothetical protein